MIPSRDILNFDLSSMHTVYEQWPEIAMDFYESKISQIDYDVDQIVFVGMGGSGTLSDVLSSVLSKAKIHTNVVKGYNLPNTIDQNTLIVVSSVSGNTDESLSILKDSLKTQAKILSFSSGEKIQKFFCHENSIDSQQIGMIHSPRATFPKFLYYILNTLLPILPITDSDIK